MDSETEQHWLVLQDIVHGSNRSLLKLRQISTKPLEILRASPKQWLQQGVSAEIVANRKAWSSQKLMAARQHQAELRALEATTVAIECPEYPPLLREIHDPPALLFVRGNSGLLQRPFLAVVGSRKASVAGCRATRDFCGGLTAAGLGICSGLALGIDGEAHRATLDSDGATVTVVATGIDQCYPRQHSGLAEEIAARGVIISEFPLGSRPLRERFPQRNRIISGLSLGVLVVEAARRSGSLITARMALEQNREVFALPHSIYHAQGRGCNALLAQGATLVETVEDILLELGPLAGVLSELQAEHSVEVSIDPAHQSLLTTLGDGALSIDELVASGTAEAAEVVGLVTEMQLRGLLENRGGRYSAC